jgi:hypothetical protein
MSLPRTARRHGIAGVAVASALLDFAAPAAAETVTTLADSGAGSLRAALDGAAPGATIDFQAGLQGTIQLDSTLEIDTSLTIAGPGARRLAVSGKDASRVFRVRGAGTEAEIRDLTIRDGLVPPTHPMGGGLLADDGAQRIRLVRVAVLENEASTTTTDLPLGGGIGVVDGTLELVDSTVAGNRAVNGGGGGVMVGDPAGFVIRGTTIAGNSASAGGGVVSFDSTGSITDSTIAGNTATTSGQGLLASDDGEITVGRSLLSGNGCGGPILSAGGNVSDAACFAAPQASDTVDPAAQVGSLADHGGPTDTMLPVPASPAVDHVGGACAAADQRGVPRPQGGACDAGAVEVRSAQLTASGPLALGTVLVGEQGSPVSTIVTNAGDRDAVITAIDLTGPSEVQAVPAGACAVSQTLAPGASCTLAARLAPTSAGLKQATYTVSLAGSSLDVAVTGTGQAPPPPGNSGGGDPPPSDPPPSPPPASSASAVVLGTGAKAAKTGKVKLRLRCQAAGIARCAGTLTLRIGARKLTRRYSIAAGKEGLVTLKLAAGDRRKLAQRRSLRSSVSVVTTQGDGSRRTTHTGAFKLRS